MMFVRQRSALLFAVILEVSAMYFPRHEGSTYKRLQRHVDWLIDEIFSHGYEVSGTNRIQDQTYTIHHLVRRNMSSLADPLYLAVRALDLWPTAVSTPVAAV